MHFVLYYSLLPMCCALGVCGTNKYMRNWEQQAFAYKRKAFALLELDYLKYGSE